MLYLKNDEELVNPLALTIKKNAVTPDWTFNKNGQNNMQVIAQVKMNEAVVTNKESILAAFDEYDKCLGTTHVTIDKNDKALFYLTTYGEKKNTLVKFRLWDATSGITYGADPDREIKYLSDSIVATYDAPVVIRVNSNIMRSLELKPTWTWVSFNVASPDAENISQLLKRGKWQDGDQLKDPESQTFYNYYRGVWNSNGTAGLVRTDRMYYINHRPFMWKAVPSSMRLTAPSPSIRNGTISATHRWSICLSTRHSKTSSPMPAMATSSRARMSLPPSQHLWADGEATFST